MPHVHHDLKVYGGIKLFAGSGSPELAQKIADYLELPLSGVEVIEFPNENLFVKLKRQCARTGCVRHPDHVFACASKFNGTAHHDPDPAAGFGGAHHGRGPLPVLRAFG
jgi:hypothetical protein